MNTWSVCPQAFRTSALQRVEECGNCLPCSLVVTPCETKVAIDSSTFVHLPIERGQAFQPALLVFFLFCLFVVCLFLCLLCFALRYFALLSLPFLSLAWLDFVCLFLCFFVCLFVCFFVCLFVPQIDSDAKIPQSEYFLTHFQDSALATEAVCSLQDWHMRSNSSSSLSK